MFAAHGHAPPSDVVPERRQEQSVNSPESLLSEAFRSHWFDLICAALCRVLGMAITFISVAIDMLGVSIILPVIPFYALK